MDNSSKTKYLDVLQIFRGIAAIMVVLHHAIGSIKYYHKVDYPILNYIGSIGKFGVDFFFLISGFIISYAAFYKYSEPNAFGNYLKNRLIRIYTPYLPIGIFMLIVYTLLPGYSNGNRDLSVLTSLTLIPNGSPALSVAWTLSFEISFYLLFSISFYSKKVWNYFIFFWFFLILLFNFGKYFNFHMMRIPITNLIFSMYNIEFILGYLLSIFILEKKKINLKFALFLTIAAAIAFLISFYFKFSVFYFSLNLLFCLFSFVLIYVSVAHFNVSIDKKAILMMIGNATYSIYLIHNPIQMVIIRFFPKIGSVLNVMSALVIVLLISCGMGYLYYYLLEKKGINLMKQKLIK